MPLDAVFDIFSRSVRGLDNFFFSNIRFLDAAYLIVADLKNKCLMILSFVSLFFDSIKLSLLYLSV